MATRYEIPTRIKELPKWCVSKDKTPLDIYALKKGREWGASFKRSHSAYGNFDQACEISSSYGHPITLFVDSQEQAIYMIDIEKTCPQEIRQAILTGLKDNILYIERSLSGKGFHLMVDLGLPIDLRTIKYKQWFEILANHHCTFTLSKVDYDTAFNEYIYDNEVITDDNKDVELVQALNNGMSPKDFYEQIGVIRNIKFVTSGEIDVYKQAAGTFDGRHADLFGILCDVVYDKTVDGDFFGDYSRYEFGYASKLHYTAKRASINMIDANANYYNLNLTKEQEIMLVYMVLKQMLPPRQKHNELRNGLPWLLYTSQMVYVKSFED